MSETLFSWLDGGNAPILTAFILGLLTAISPCPLATNITAIGFLSKDVNNYNRVFINGLLYTLGRTIAYSAIGFFLIPMLREGKSIYIVQKSLAQYGELLIGPFLILIGLFMLFGHHLNLSAWGKNQGGERLKSWGGIGALLLGMLFALAFCPTSGVLYFGMLMPMAAADNGGYWIPVIYALATGIPVLIIAWMVAYSLSGIGRFYQKMVILQKWMNRIIASLFIAVGIYYLIIFYF